MFPAWCTFVLRRPFLILVASFLVVVMVQVVVSVVGVDCLSLPSPPQNGVCTECAFDRRHHRLPQIGKRLLFSTNMTHWLFGWAIFISSRGLITRFKSEKHSGHGWINILHSLASLLLLFHIQLTVCLLLVACFYLNCTPSLLTESTRALVWFIGCECKTTAIPALIKFLLRNESQFYPTGKAAQQSRQ